MKINSTGYNAYSPGMGNLRGNSPQTITPVQNSKNTAKPGTASPASPVSQSVPQSAPQGIASPETNSQGTEDLEKPQNENQHQANDTSLSRAELQLLTELEQVDTKVRSHEMAHVAAGGGLITSGASFTYKKGPDGKDYAVAGEVGIDTSVIPGDPQATLQKMQQVKRSAMAPASPSSQDLKVASKATAMASKALSELSILRAKEQAASNEIQAFGNLKQASDSYTKVNTLPEVDTNTFTLAV
jgi:hypothetical protein